MRVLHLLNSDKLSGAENVAAEIIKVLGDEFDMAYSSPNGSIKQSLYERSIKYIPLKNFTKKEIALTIKGYMPDIIHAHDISASIQAVRSVKNIPVVSQIHGNHDNMKKITLKSTLFMLFSLKMKHIIAVSKSTLDEYKFSRIIRNKSSIIYNVIDKNRIIDCVNKDIKHYNYDFVYLGRLSEPKDPKRIATIATKILMKSDTSRFGIIGDGDMICEMKEIFVLNNVIDRVDFLGFMSNPYKVLSQAKVMIMCSRYEGTPIAVLEAMALGVPVVSTPTDGVIDIIESGKNGYTFKSDTDIEDAILNIISDHKVYQKLSVGAINFFQTYNNLFEYKKEIRRIYVDAFKQ